MRYAHSRSNFLCTAMLFAMLAAYPLAAQQMPYEFMGTVYTESGTPYNPGTYGAGDVVIVSMGGQYIASTSINADGSYWIEGTAYAAGGITLRSSAGSYPMQYYHPVTNTSFPSEPFLAQPGGMYSVDIILRSSPRTSTDTCGTVSVSGMLYSENSGPLGAGYTVLLVDSAGTARAQYSTGSDSWFHFNAGGLCGKLYVKFYGGSIYPPQYYSNTGPTIFPFQAMPYNPVTTCEITMTLSESPMGSSSGSGGTAIEGLVLDPQKLPVQGAVAILYNVATMQPADSAVTNSYGEFLLENFPASSNMYLKIRPNRQGLPDQYWTPTGNTTPSCGSFAMQQGTTFHIRVNQTSSPHATCPSPRTIGAVRGFLFDSSGMALENVRVDAYPAGSSTAAATATTSRDGEYVLYDLQIGANNGYNLRFDPTGSYPYLPVQWWTSYGTSSTAQQGAIPVPWQTLFLGQTTLWGQTGTSDTSYASGSATVFVYLYNENGGSVWPNAEVELESDTWQHYMGQPVNGRYEWRNLAPGNYAIGAWADGYQYQYYSPDRNTAWPDYFKYVNNGDTAVVYFYLSTYVMGDSSQWQPPDTGSGKIAGVVRTEDGTAVAAATVSALNMNYGGFDECMPQHNSSQYTAQTNSSGAYTIERLPDGDYIVVVTAESQNLVARYYPNTENAAQHQTVAVHGTQVGNVDFTLRTGAVVHGFIKATSGQPLAYVNIDVHANMGCLTYEVQTDANGQYLLGGIAPGSYNMDFEDENRMYFPTQTPPSFSLVAGQRKSMTDVILAPGGRFTGQFSTSTTQWDSAAAMLVLYSATPGTYDSYIWPAHTARVMVGSDGRTFTTDRCPPGQWRLVLMPMPKGIYDSTGTASATSRFVRHFGWTYVGGATTFAAAAPYQIVSSQDKSLSTVGFRSGYSVLGTITAEGAETMGYTAGNYSSYMWYGVNVYVRQDGYLVLVGTSYNLQGNVFEIPGLVDGEEYFLEIHCSFEYPDQWWGPNGNTAGPDYAYRFSTASFTPLNLELVHTPEGYDQNSPYQPWQSENRPSSIKGLKITPAGFNAFLLSWNRSPAGDSVAQYRIWRFNDPKESDFVVNSQGYWEPAKMDSILNTVDSFHTTDTFFIDTTAVPNVNYIYVVAAINTQGHDGYMEQTPASIPFSSFLKKISYSSFPTTYAAKPGVWDMVGPAGLDSLPVPQVGERKVYRWDDKKEPTKLLAHYTEVNMMRAARGYWIYSSPTASTAAPLTLTMSAQSFNRLYANRNAVAVQLMNGHTGWNLVSSPFPFAVSPSWLSTQFVAFEWQPGSNMYKQATELKPWRAYWVYNHTGKDTVLSVSPKPSALAAKSLAKAAGRGGWQVQVALEGAHSADPDNFAGVVPRALEKTHLIRSPEPPRAFEFAQLYFLSGQEKLSAHYQVSPSVPAQRLEWTVAVASSDEPQTIRISGLESVPPEVALYWVDNTGAIDLRQKPSVALQPHESTRYGCIVATANPFDMALYAGRLELRRSFPNPFTAATTIEFVVPFAWNADGSRDGADARRVSLVVYDLSGRTVAQLVSGAMKVGVHRRVWDGTGANGKDVPSGVYLARLTSDNVCKTIRMFRLQ